MRSTAPPENMLNMPRMPPALLLERLREGVGIDARHRDIGAEAIDEQRAEREPDALLEILGLGEGREPGLRKSNDRSRPTRSSDAGVRAKHGQNEATK
jgi:hypothetical protein